MVVTSRLLQAYLLHIQDDVLHYAAPKPHVRHVNTSATGALIRGMEHATLVATLAPFATPAVLRRAVLRDAHATSVRGARPSPEVHGDAWITGLASWLS